MLPHNGFLIDRLIKKGNKGKSRYRVSGHQKMFRKWPVKGKPDYNAYGISEKAQVVYPIAQHGNIFVDLLEHPEIMSIVDAFMGPDVQMADNALHVKPAGTRSHTDWHRDERAWFHMEADAWNVEDQRVWEQMRVCETPFLT